MHKSVEDLWCNVVKQLWSSVTGFRMMAANYYAVMVLGSYVAHL